MTHSTDTEPEKKLFMSELLGIAFEPRKAGETTVAASLAVTSKVCQPFGVLNGGASLALAETLAGYGSMGLLAPDEIPLGIEVDAHHIASVPEGGTVRAVATLLQKGRVTHLWNVDITDTRGRLISTARVVNQIVKKRS